MMLWILLGWMTLSGISRLCDGKQGVKFTLKAAPFTHEWELFDWWPRWTANKWDTGDEQQVTIRYYQSYALTGEVLFLRWSVVGARFLYEMTRTEAETLQMLAPKYRYDNNGKELLLNPKQLPEYKQRLAEYTARGRTVRAA